MFYDYVVLAGVQCNQIIIIIFRHFRYLFVFFSWISILRGELVCGVCAWAYDVLNSIIKALYYHSNCYILLLEMAQMFSILFLL